MPRPRRPKNDPHFTWQEGDVTLVLPQQPTTVISDELHTILWSLEHVSNKTALAEVMSNVAAYLEFHSSDKNLVDAAVLRAQQRVEHST